MWTAPQFEGWLDVTERVERLRQAIEISHRCKAVHIRSTRVIEGCEGETTWEGIVEIFDLLDHPVAKRCYAWSFMDNGARGYTIILDASPVNTPEIAVKAALAAQARQVPD